MNTIKTLEFDQILDMLAGCAVSGGTKRRCLELRPTLSEAEARRRMDETTQAKTIIEAAGAPPLPATENILKVLALADADAMLVPEQISQVSSFLTSCRRMKHYLKKAEATGADIAAYGASIIELTGLEDEIDRSIVNGAVDDRASPALSSVRRQMALTADQIRQKLDALLRKNRDWFSESYVTVKNGHFTLPVRREHKNDVSGALIEMSNSGGTCFIEPASVGKLNDALRTLEIEEDGEVRRILYALTALIDEAAPELRLNIEALETLDFLFAKGKLGVRLGASPVTVSAGGPIRVNAARHPLLEPGSAVPLDFEPGGDIRGVVVTGPNTGGKTVAIKTVGLLSLMAQSGLHVPAAPGSVFRMFGDVLCDIGDGQSISENLSTFSSHMKNIIAILEAAGPESLVLLDELGSGTDPAEGMGLAIAILEALCVAGCFFAVTTHYPEVKEYAQKKPGVINARMAFDKESLMPLYRLELGEAGESCALYIARRLGMPESVLTRAREAAYGKQGSRGLLIDVSAAPESSGRVTRLEKQKERREKTSPRSESFHIGDSVIVYPQKEIGLVYQRANAKGELGVQVKGVKKLVNHKRIKLHVPAAELYPDDYDFSVVFDTVANRKARHILGKRHEEGTVVVIKEGDDSK